MLLDIFEQEAIAFLNNDGSLEFPGRNHTHIYSTPSSALSKIRNNINNDDKN
jgi:hypothetical protein